MRKLSIICIFLFLATTAPIRTHAQVFNLNQIASTTQASPYFGVIMGDGTGSHKATASSSPTVRTITATSTTASSTLPRLNITTGVNFMGQYFENLLTYLTSVCSTITGSAGLCDGNDATGGGTGSGTVSTSTNEVAGRVAYWTSNSGTPALLGQVPTTTIGFTGPFTGFTSIGTLIGGANTTVVWTGLATTSQPSSSNILVSNGGAGVYGVATGTVSATLPLSVTAGRACIGGACAFSIADAIADGSTKGASTYTTNDFDTASGVVSLDYANGQKATASVSGFLSSTDWQRFNTWPWTITSYGESTTTVIGFTNGIMAIAASSTIGNGVSSLNMYGAATSSLSAVGTSTPLVLLNPNGATSTAVSLAFATFASTTNNAATTTGAITGVLTQATFSGGPGAAKGDLVFSTLRSGSLTEAFRVKDTGFFGIATSSPGSTFSIGGIVNMTTATDTFYGTGGISITSGCFAVGTTCLVTSGNTYGWPFTVTTYGESTSTLINFTGGILSMASTTIGNGTTSGGLTIYGTATSSLLVNGATSSPHILLNPGSATGTAVQLPFMTLSSTTNSSATTTAAITSILTQATFGGGPGAAKGILTFSILNTGLLTEAARFASNGWFGIATTSPGSLFSLGSLANFTTATSSFYSTGGIDLAAGCFSIKGTCIGGGSAGITSAIPSTQTFTSSGTWTKPSGVTLVHVRVVGSGGAGGGCASSGSRHSAGGGGSGAYSEGTTTVSGNVTVTVGAFVAGSSGGVGGNGATSTFAGDRSISGGGGYGGALAVDGTNVLGGNGGATTTGGYLNIEGQKGSPGIVNGAIGMVSGGTGGSTPLGYGGMSSADATTAQVGVSGTGYGSGGGACYDNGNNTAMAGGNSGGGIVIVDW